MNDANEHSASQYIPNEFLGSVVQAPCDTNVDPTDSVDRHTTILISINEYMQTYIRTSINPSINTSIHPSKYTPNALLGRPIQAPCGMDVDPTDSAERLFEINRSIFSGFGIAY